MLLHLSPRNRKCAVRLVIETNSPRQIFMAGADPDHKNTEFFMKVHPVLGREEHFFGMPISPNNLEVFIGDTEEGEVANSRVFKIISLDLIPIREVYCPVDKLTRDFVEFAEEFALKAGYLPALEYEDKKGQFLIDYMKKLPVATPARIHKDHDFIQVDQEKMRESTVPRRIAVLFHEFAHNYLNYDQDDEVEADFWALKLYLCRGFPVQEGESAFTSVFHDSEQNRIRLQWIDKFLKEFNLNYNGDIVQGVSQGLY